MPFQISLVTDQTGANTAIHSGFPVIFNFSVTQTYLLYEGNFSMKKGSSSTNGVTATLYNAANGGGTAVASVFIAESSFFQTYTNMSFLFNEYNLLAGTYSLVLSSTTSSGGSSSYFIKAGSFQVTKTSDGSVLTVGYGIASTAQAITTINSGLKLSIKSISASSTSLSTTSASSQVNRPLSLSLTGVNSTAFSIHQSQKLQSSLQSLSQVTSQATVSSLSSSASLQCNSEMISHANVKLNATSDLENTLAVSAFATQTYNGISENTITNNVFAQGDIVILAGTIIQTVSEITANANVYHLGISNIAVTAIVAATPITNYEVSNNISVYNQISANPLINYYATSTIENQCEMAPDGRVIKFGIFSAIETSIVLLANADIYYFASTNIETNTNSEFVSNLDNFGNVSLASTSEMTNASIVLLAPVCQLQAMSELSALSIKNSDAILGIFTNNVLIADGKMDYSASSQVVCGSNNLFSSNKNSAVNSSFEIASFLIAKAQNSNIGVADWTCSTVLTARGETGSQLILKSTTTLGSNPTVFYNCETHLVTQTEIYANYEVFIDPNMFCVGLRCLGIKAGECKTCQNGLAYWQYVDEAYLPAMTVCIQELTTKSAQPKEKYIYRLPLPRRCRTKILNPYNLYY